MFLRQFSLCVASSLALIGSVQAAELGQPAGVTDWSGFYAGITAGYGFADAQQTSTFGGLKNSVEMDGALGGIHAGYNFQHGQIVVGAEVDFSISNIEGTLASAAGQTCFVATPNCHQGIENLFTARARAGMAVGRFLPYLTGGIAIADITENTGAPAADVKGGYETSWVAGAGAEFRVTEAISVRAEYLAMDFPSQSRVVGAATQTNDTELLSVFRAGLSFAF